VTKKFEPTKEQLEKLANTADKVLYDHSGVYHLCDTYLSEIQEEWQPHKDMNQIAMVIEGLTEGQTEEYNNSMYAVYFKLTKFKYNFAIWLAYTADPSVSCEKLLEVVG